MVSHLAMLPFLFLIVYQAIALGNVLFPENKRFSWFTTAMVLSECALVAQSTMVSPDVIVAALFLSGINAILKKKNGNLLIIILGAGLISMRAMMMSVPLYIFALSFYNKEKDGYFFWFARQKIWPFIPGALLGLSFLIFHFYKKGWIGYHESSPWAGAFQRVGIIEFLRNVMVLAWRMVDLGKVITVLVFLWMLLSWWRQRKKLKGDKKLFALSILWIAMFIFTALSLCFYTGLMQHRYLIPMYFATAILTLYLLAYLPIKHKGIVFGLMLFCQLSGHFWTYPRQYSQGWDCTLALLPYYGLRNEFNQYILQHHLPKSKIGSYFSLVNSDFATNLKGDTTRYKNYLTDSVAYIWYSNVNNSPVNAYFNTYFKHWTVLKKAQKGHVVMILFKRPPN